APVAGQVRGRAGEGLAEAVVGKVPRGDLVGGLDMHQVPAGGVLVVVVQYVAAGPVGIARHAAHVVEGVVGIDFLAVNVRRGGHGHAVAPVIGQGAALAPGIGCGRIADMGDVAVAVVAVGVVQARGR